MNRRNFLKFLIAGAGVTTIGTLAVTDFDEVLINIVREDTKKLNVQNNAIKKFINDSKKANTWARYSFAKKEFIRMHYLLENPVFPLPYNKKYKEYKNFITGTFLLSTNFFTNHMDENIPIKYIALYNPYHHPCSNPFSNLYYPS